MKEKDSSIVLVEDKPKPERANTARPRGSGPIGPRNPRGGSLVLTLSARYGTIQLRRDQG